MVGQNDEVIAAFVCLCVILLEQQITHLVVQYENIYYYYYTIAIAAAVTSAFTVAAAVAFVL